MKIAILSPFYPYRGGIAQFSAMLYEAMREKHEVKAFSFSRLYPGFLFPGKTQYVEKGDQAIEIPSERILDSINPFSYQKTAKEIGKFQPDVLIIVYWMSFFGPAYGHIANRLKKKTVIISLVHNAIPHEPKFFDKPFAKLLFDQCNGFVVMSDIVRNDILSMNPESSFCVRPHPLYSHFGEKIDVLLAKEKLGLDPDKKTLLFFGLIRDYKGLDLLIDAMAGLGDDFQLLIAGESYGSFEKYETQISHSPAKDRIFSMNQYIEDSLVPVLFSAADLLVLPYKSATQSGVVPVAYHFEVPVVATDVGGLRDMVERPGAGIICSPDSENIASAVERIFSLGRDRFVSNIRTEKENLSWGKFADEMVEFSKSLMS
ncbi:MAG: glycosyltransferase [Dysgonamonadaceae bacterium]|jgi:glycosyltransferase involved in cell wall biosynthesis|nr:glycosyltransferase [Dysgonamonadaceae bacterium]